VAEVIEQTFGVRYHRDHVERLLRKACWSRQKPMEQATQRNEEAITRWHEERWSELKKAEREKATIIWVNGAGFYLLPLAVHTWASTGQTPRLARQTDARSPLGDQWHQPG
jgi:Winged helix-turn helix